MLSICNSEIVFEFLDVLKAVGQTAKTMAPDYMMTVGNAVSGTARAAGLGGVALGGGIGLGGRLLRTAGRAMKTNQMQRQQMQQQQHGPQPPVAPSYNR